MIRKQLLQTAQKIIIGKADDPLAAVADSTDNNR
jgi:hypothetical protein